MSTLDGVCDFFKIPKARLAESPVLIEDANRTRRAACFGALGFKHGAEIGVESGRFSEELCQQNPGVRLLCVDAWAAYQGYREHVTQAKVDGLFAAAQERLKSYHVTFRRAFSVEAAAKVPDGSLDFCYIDANHSFPYVVADIAAWLPKVRKGGIISGHDYCRRGGNGYQLHVIEAVQGWTQAYHVAPWFLIGHTGIAPGDHRDRPKSWFWIKE
jgi:hypothetical protein